MAWVKVPPENRPIFHEALPNDPRVETMPMFGGVAARANGHMFAGLFGRSTVIWLPAEERDEALALEGATRFDPMGDGRARSDKVMLPEAMMDDPTELRRWVARAFRAVLALPRKVNVAKKKSGDAKAKPSPRKRRMTTASSASSAKTKVAKRKSRP